MQYRPDIDALRTIAVVPVILFHLGVSGFGGGYVGVDVFFVISGYLITSVILGKGEGFSILDFYKMRARRILPALFVVVLAAMVAGYFLMLPVDFKRLSQSAVAVATFSSNILFWLQNGYFDTAAHLKPLLHTWSLGVEEQFYIVFPLIMLLMNKFDMSLRAKVVVLSALGILSLALAVGFPGYERGDAFYLPQYRAWELMLGAVLAMTSPSAPRQVWLREALALAGVMLILVPVFLYTDRTPFPGINAIYPCVGAALIIYSRTEKLFVVGRLLRNPGAIFVGKISYSLYLWHWPIIVFYQYYTMGRTSPLEKTMLLAVTFLLSWLSWRYVETPVRTSNLSAGKILTTAAASSMAVIALGMIGHVEKGFPGRFETQVAHLDSRQAYHPGTCFLDKKQTYDDWSAGACTFRTQLRQNAPTILVWGDSHAAHLVPGLTELQTQIPFNMMEATFAGCPPVAGYSEYGNPNCSSFNKGMLDFIAASKPDIVLLSARWDAFRDPYYLEDALKKTVTSLRAHNVMPVLLGDSPSFAAPVPDIAFLLQERGVSASLYRHSNSFRSDDTVRRVATQMDVPYFSPRKQLCNPEGCLLKHDEKLLYWDESHFTVSGSRYFSSLMAGFIKKTLAKEAGPQR